MTAPASPVVNSYDLKDRLKEISSYLGIAAAAVGTVLPQLGIDPATVKAIEVPIFAIIGAALFFLPENRYVKAVSAAADDVESNLPAQYKVTNS